MVWMAISQKPSGSLEITVLLAAWASSRKRCPLRGLIGDSSISSANHLCRISEKAEMPSLADVSQFLSRRQGERWIAFLMDISKAHTRVNVPPKERGFSLFAVMEPGGRRRWVAYNTCRFGCSRATYGWSRSSRHLVWALPCDLRG